MDERKCSQGKCNSYSGNGGSMSAGPYGTGSSGPQWGPWSRWSACSATCKGGKRQRLRKCSKKGQCQGSNKDVEECNKNVKCENNGYSTGVNSGTNLFGMLSQRNDGEERELWRGYNSNSQVSLTSDCFDRSEPFYFLAMRLKF